MGRLDRKSGRPFSLLRSLPRLLLSARQDTNRWVIPRVLPFAAYMAFLALAEGVAWLNQAAPTLAAWGPAIDLWLYPVKTTVVLGALAYFWPRYEELKGRMFGGIREALFAVTAGIVVYLAWVRMDWPWAMQGVPAGFDPFRAGEGPGIALVVVRIFGATMVVPVMEELFWRSFLLRYLINPSRFEAVRLGTVTPLSGLATIVLFGTEHHLWLAGMLAGAAYTFVLYRTGRLWPCILAHAVTNLALGIHVLVTGEWNWW
jgi:CAAX prenyl protease-like protein